MDSEALRPIGRLWKTAISAILAHGNPCGRRAQFAVE